MTKIVKAITLLTILTSVQSLEPLDTGNGENILHKIVQMLSKKSSSVQRRTINASLNKTSGLYNKLTKSTVTHKDGMKPVLRTNQRPENTEDQQALLVENELKDSLNDKQSALLDHPYVEHQGKNDYLVLRPDVVDPFVTVIPNNIYYNAEKKCVNWLDDCSLKGIRAQLLRGVQSPYR